MVPPPPPPPRPTLQVKVLTEEEYAERQRQANYTRAVPARHSFEPTTAHGRGSNITMRVVETTHTPAPARYFVADHALDGVNASVQEALRAKLADLPPAPGPESFPQPGDLLEPGAFGLEPDWALAPSDDVEDFDVKHASDGGGGATEVSFSAGSRWGRGDGADVLLAEELRRRRIARQAARRHLTQEQFEEEDEEDGDQDLLLAGETLEGLRERLAYERITRANASATGIIGAGAVRPGAALELSDSMISSFAKQMDLEHLGPAENPVDMRGLMMRRENGEGSSLRARAVLQLGLRSYLGGPGTCIG